VSSTGSCRSLRASQFGVGTVTSVAIWAELGEVHRFGNSDTWPATPAWTSLSTPPMANDPPVTCPAGSAAGSGLLPESTLDERTKAVLATPRDASHQHAHPNRAQ